MSVLGFWATVAMAVGIDLAKQNRSNLGRLIRMADADSRPIQEVLR